jgi:hypothetical protein
LRALVTKEFTPTVARARSEADTNSRDRVALSRAEKNRFLGEKQWLAFIVFEINKAAPNAFHERASASFLQRPCGDR